LIIRKRKDHVVNAPKARAGRKRRALEAEVRELLCDVATGGTPETLHDLADRIAALTPDLPQTDSSELVRAERG
jgi:plasmid stability protein